MQESQGSAASAINSRSYRGQPQPQPHTLPPTSKVTPILQPSKSSSKPLQTPTHPPCPSSPPYSPSSSPCCTSTSSRWNPTSGRPPAAAKPSGQHQPSQSRPRRWPRTRGSTTASWLLGWLGVCCIRCRGWGFRSRRSFWAVLLWRAWWARGRRGRAGLCLFRLRRRCWRVRHCGFFEALGVKKVWGLWCPCGWILGGVGWRGAKGLWICEQRHKAEQLHPNGARCSTVFLCLVYSILL